MSATITVFVNERPVHLPTGSVVRDALALALPELLSACEQGDALVTDGRALPVGLGEPLVAGAILRAARSSRRGRSDA